MANKKQKFGEAASPFTMKGSPHKLGTIEGTSAFKKQFAVEQTRTSGDAVIVGAASELGSSYIPAAQDYTIKTGHITKDKKGGKKDPPTEEEQTDAYVEKELAEAHEGKYGEGLFGGYLRRKRAQRKYKRSGHSEEEIIDTSDLTKKERLQLGESLYPEKESKTKEEKARKKKEEARRKSMSDFSWSEYFKTGELYEQ